MGPARNHGRAFSTRPSNQDARGEMDAVHAISLVLLWRFPILPEGIPATAASPHFETRRQIARVRSPAVPVIDLRHRAIHEPGGFFRIPDCQLAERGSPVKILPSLVVVPEPP